VTEFGCDASDFDWGRGPMDVAAMYADGIRWLTHKATEGTSTRHVNYGRALTRARDAGIPVLGAYHVVRSVGALSSQVKAFTAYLDQATPWWRSHPNFLLQVDLERWPYDDVAGSTGTAFAEQLAGATGKTVIIYASKGQYGNGLGGSRPLWNAAYPSGASGHYRELYPGDNGFGWQSYSGRVPVMWQYTSSATIGGQHGCDANAYRGTLAQLLALAAGGAAPNSSPGGPVVLGDDDILAIADAVAQWATVKGALPASHIGARVNLNSLAAKLDTLATAVAKPPTITLSADQLSQLVSALEGLVPTLEEIDAAVDKAVKARLDGATVHTAGS
jgi:GH25 family lysozyme M1 (1,4-beta-N-acetylmuramidase)